MLKKLLGIAPLPTKDGAYSPSKLALKLATSAKTDLSDATYANRYQGDKPKVLVVCTEAQSYYGKRQEVFHGQSSGRGPGANDPS